MHFDYAILTTMYFNQGDAGILAMMVLITMFGGFGSFLLMLGVSFRLVRGKNDEMGWQESERSTQDRQAHLGCFGGGVHWRRTAC